MNWGLAGGIVASLIAVWLLFLGTEPSPISWRTSLSTFGARAALVGLLVWLINPIDLIPEFMPACRARRQH